MKTLFSLLLLCCLSGCASILTNSAQPVYIASQPNGADFVIRNANNVEIARGQTPKIVILESGAGFFVRANYWIEYSQTKQAPQNKRLSAYFNPWFIGNIIIPPGSFVDGATGAMWRLPETATVPLMQSQ